MDFSLLLCLITFGFSFFMLGVIVRESLPNSSIKPEKIESKKDYTKFGSVEWAKVIFTA